MSFRPSINLSACLRILQSPLSERKTTIFLKIGVNIQTQKNLLKNEMAVKYSCSQKYHSSSCEEKKKIRMIPTKKSGKCFDRFQLEQW